MLDVLRSKGREEQQAVANDGGVDKMLQARTSAKSRRVKGNDASEDMLEEVHAILADLLENARIDAAKTERARAEAQYQQVSRTASV